MKNKRNSRPVRVTITGIYKDYQSMKEATEAFSTEIEKINYAYWSRQLFRIGVTSIEIKTDNFGVATFEKITKDTMPKSELI